MLPLLAYGGFRSWTYSGMFWECWPRFLSWIVPALLLYAVASFICEHCRIRAAGVLVFIAVFFVLVPGMVVMGEYGPAHVAAEAGSLIWPLLCGLLVIKTATLYAGDWRRRKRTMS